LRLLLLAAMSAARGIGIVRCSSLRLVVRMIGSLSLNTQQNGRSLAPVLSTTSRSVLAQPVGPERRRPARSTRDRCSTGNGATDLQTKLDDISCWLPQMGVIEGVNIVQSAVYWWRDATSLESVAGIRPGPWRAKGDDRQWATCTA
jgi:hypothetical protein